MYADLDEFIANSGKTAEVLRALAVRNDVLGTNRSQIALMLNCSVSFVSKWRLIYDEYGADGLHSLHQGGSSRALLSPEQKQAVLDYIRRQKTLTVEALKSYIQITYRVVYRSQQSYYVLLHQAGFSYHKGQAANAKHDPLLVAQTRKAVKKNSGR